MLREFAARTPLLILPLSALALFGAIFALVLVVTMKRRASSFDPIAALPLSDEGESSVEVHDGLQ